ncbi:ROK family protein [Aeromonas sp. MdU4]|uniref:ROK family protein n=1 Tax=Aeromonas sp. MdU4 TaxID=3342819 RepID=UPI0035BB5598
MKSQGYYIGIDWGGTRIKWGAVTESGEFLHKDTYNYSCHSDINCNVNIILDNICDYINNQKTMPLGIGISLTSIVDPFFGVVYLPGKINGLAQFPIVDKVKQKFHCPVKADNDGRCALLSERYFGKAQDIDWAVTLTIGTGIGSGVLLDGQVLRNPHLQFGTQMGHLMIFGNTDQTCLTGFNGTGEMTCSSTALVIDVRSGLERGIPSILSPRYAMDVREITFKTIIEEGVRKGDKFCVDLFDKWIKRLSFLIVNAIHAYGPQRVILSGGATLASDLFLERLQTLVDQKTFIYPPGTSIPIVVSDCQEHNGVLGSICLFK